MQEREIIISFEVGLAVISLEQIASREEFVLFTMRILYRPRFDSNSESCSIIHIFYSTRKNQKAPPLSLSQLSITLSLSAESYVFIFCYSLHSRKHNFV